jgi:apolipoprotein N-acyltransferase
MMTRLAWLWALLAGALIPLSLTPYDIWPAAILSLLALQFLLHSLHCDSPKSGFWLGWWHALGMFGAGTSWVYVSIHVYGHASVGLAVALTALFSMGLALFGGLTFYMYKRFFPGWTSWHIALFPAIWVLGEWLRSWFLTGFPWLYIGYSQTDGPLAAWAPVSGVLGISFLLALSVSSLFASYRTRKFIYALPIAALATASVAVSNIEWVKPTGDKRSVALVQANIDQNEKWVASLIPGHIKLHQEMSEPLWDSDIIVWPESAVPQLLQRSESLIAQLTSQAKESNTAFITGIPHYDIANKSFHNSILGLGDASGHYLKRRLVPFGEYVPLEDWLRGLIEFFDLPMSNFRPGPAEQEDLHAGELSLAPLICYEVVYPDMIRRGAGRQADLLLTISNDTWFGASIGPLQHLQMARMRAKETGRAMIRGTNNGVSALIDADGSILKQSRQFQREVLRGDVSIYTGDTLVSRYGHRPLLGLCLTLLVLPLLTAKLRARQANS